MKIWHFSSFSLPGGREVNEDHVCMEAASRRWIGVVADGLGGQGGGDRASQIAAEEALRQMKEMPRINPAAVQGMFEKINAMILAEQTQAGCRMMSTLAVISVQGRHAIWAHLGDTRIYRFRNGQMLSCSRDHSVTQTLYDRGEITREEMRTHETRNLLLQSLGQMAAPKPEIHQSLLWGRETFLLCTDGFWEKFSDEELTSAVKGESADRILEGLKETALKRASEASDNLSALLFTE